MSNLSPRRIALAAGVLIAAAAASAHAQSVGYVATTGGSVSPVESYNSAGGANSLTVLGTGLYEVTLGGLGNSLNSNVEVNAVNTNGQGHFCTSDGWFSPNGLDVTADVACFDISGNPLPADFSLFYQARTAAPSSGQIAFLWADQPFIPQFSSYNPDSLYSFNSTGGTNSVTHEGTGVYFAFLPGFKQTGNPQVTAYGGSAAHCEVADWYQNSAGANVSVYCVNAAGVATDGYFNLSYTQGALESAGPTATSLGAYVWANNLTKKNYTPAKSRQLNTVPTGLVTTQRFGGLVAGQYSFTLPNSDGFTFSTLLAMVTANGTNGEFCDTAGGVNIPPGQLYQDLICYDSQGRQTDTLYTGTLFSTR